ncbi:MAG: carboxymuconolactone decarboxylase family protein [Acidobacteria bacterium]|nr:carboxymuconolactone decarboxylase family protein [Acidobacteriota bacterium]
MTGQRLPPLRPESLDDAQRALYDEISGGPRSAGGHFALRDHVGALTGPFNAMLLAPSIGTPLQQLGSAIRYGGTLPDRARELAILLVARADGSAFERYAHERVGAAIGMTEAELAAIQSGDVHIFTDPEEQLIIQLVSEILDSGNVTEARYREAVDAHSAAWLFELTTLVGYYRLLALQLKIFGVD